MTPTCPTCACQEGNYSVSCNTCMSAWKHREDPKHKPHWQAEELNDGKKH